MSKNSYIVHDDFYYQIEHLPDEIKGRLWDSIFRYRLFEEIPDKNDYLLYSLFIQFKNQFDRDNEKYEQKCIRNSLNGSKGGRPKTEKTQSVLGKPKKSERLISKPKKADNDNEQCIVNSEQCIVINDNDVSSKDKSLKETEDNINIYCPENVFSEPKQSAKTIELRKMEFMRDCVQVNTSLPTEDALDTDELRNFCEYWTESKPSGKKFRAEMEKVFDKKRRIRTWKNKQYSNTNLFKTNRNGTDRGNSKPSEEELKSAVLAGFARAEFNKVEREKRN